jgi:type 2 lantibiotic biosynthesis protein LanM
VRAFSMLAWNPTRARRSTGGLDPVDLESSDWYRAATLTERVVSLQQAKPSEGAATDQVVRSRIEDWVSDYPQLSGENLASYLVACGISEQHFLRILQEPIEAVRDRLGASSPWLERVRSSFRAGVGSDRILSEELSSRLDVAPLLNLVEPLIREARHRLHVGLASLRNQVDTEFTIDDDLERLLLGNAARRLLEMLIPTLVLELNVARMAGVLDGETQQQRFESYAARLRQPDLALGLLVEYPVLARHLVVYLDHWTVYTLEYLRRLAEDWNEVCAHFRNGDDPGALISVDDTKGDPHQAGRSVLILSFKSGFRLVYKPRPLAVAKHFQEFLAWINNRGAEPPLRTIRILDRGAYGWAEFVAQEDCLTPDEVRRFYARQGEYLAVFYALQGTDFHYENLIAAGEHPVYVDLETLFQPHTRVGAQADSKLYSDSVLRIGLLPQRIFGDTPGDGIDLSGLGATAGQTLPYAVAHLALPGTDEMRLVQADGECSGADNLPKLNGATVDITDYAKAVIDGFSALYGLLLDHWDELLSEGGPLSRFRGDSIRVVLRPTLTYGLLLRSSLHPDVLRDALDRDIMLGSLWGHTRGQGDLERVFASEIDDLSNLDVPLFTTRVCSIALSTSSGQVIPEFFPEAGWLVVQRRLARFGKDDLQRQIWFIRAALAAIAGGRGPGRSRIRPRDENQEPAPGRRQLMAAAEAIGKRLDALALQDGESTSWAGFTLSEKGRWCLSPLGLDLYDGLPGVAFFLAYLGVHSREARYTTLAKKAVNMMHRQLATPSPNGPPIGAFEGLGGLVYVLSHLSTLWDDSDLLREAELIAGRLRALIRYDRKFDITGGAAGGIMGCLALYRVAPRGSVLAAAVECGEHLLSHAQSTRGAVAWPSYFPAEGPLTGLAHGASGIGWALLELAAVSGDERFKEAALAAFGYERSLFSAERRNWPDLRVANNSDGRSFMVGWCHGAPGIALTRFQALKHISDPEIGSEGVAGLETTIGEGFRGDHSLCHGSLGNIDLLLQAYGLVGTHPWKSHISRISAAILQSIADDGWICGVPLGIETPGLMTGIAGIGYGLLRLAEPSNTPTVLALAPPMGA